jgi:hypothetical protein
VGVSEAEANPNETVAAWDDLNQCVKGLSWEGDIETLLRNTLPGEWIPSWHMESLKSGATIIRQDMWYKYNHPEGNWGLPFCPGVPSYFFHWRDSYLAGFLATPPHSRTDEASNATWAYGWSSSSISKNDLELLFGDCLQNTTQNQALNGYVYTEITGSGAYPPGVYAPGNPCGSPALAPLAVTCLYGCGGGGGGR